MMKRISRILIIILILIIAIGGTIKAKASSDNNTNEVVENKELLELYNALKEKEYSDKDLESVIILEQIAELKNDGNSTNEVIKIIDESQNRRNLVDKIYNKWNNLTVDEKELIVKQPINAMAALAASNKAIDITLEKFGKNGLGDKSDGFRHAIWCALMARDAEANFAKEFSNAHESGKTEEMLEQLARDGFKERDHMEMDLHNNGIGISLITDINVSNEEVIDRVTSKLTNDKNNGIYWLHD